VTTKAQQIDAPRQQLHFTAAEQRVLVLLPTHLTEEAIAERLGRRRSTVKTHVAHIYKKLGARSRGEAVARAREKRLLPDPDAETTRSVMVDE
jgi:LuxR family maltose regulon positive regulatory protein